MITQHFLVTVNLTIRLPLALIQPEPASRPEPQTAPEPEAHSCHSCHSCGGCGKCQHGKVSPDAGCPEGDRFPVPLRPIPCCPDIRDRCPGEQFLPPLLTCSMTGQINGQHLVSLGADHLGEGLRLFLAAHLSMEKYVSLSGRFPI